MKFANRKIAPGEVKEFDLKAAETAAGPVTIPCTVIRGAEDGPVLAVTAACHPMELNGVLASIRLVKAIKPEKLRGTVAIVHVQNVFGFMMRRGHISPLDGVNMGTAFSAEDSTVEEGGSVSHQGKSVTHQIADCVFRHFNSKADYLIDLHGGELHESLMSNIEILPIGDEETDQRTREFAASFGFDHVWEVPHGSIPEMPSYPARGSAVMECMQSGIPAVYCEVGSEGRLEEPLVDQTVKGILNAMRTLKMLPGRAEKKTPRTLVGGHVLFAGRGGLFVAKCAAGDTLRKNQIIGQIIDVRGEVVEKIRCPRAGVLTNINTLGVVNPGDMLYVIGNT
ncbi:succinylglutamate desuccinylase/aspartoacylase family protein [Elongatibacter sediminis]|uniref:Succinylglutamate desuccinylase/aspartoacylase family protein n=1 Tax=Elongatibacter sediminis TaxID=3119006 RepID=A0AAW9RLZ5_9GAMM